MLNNYLKTAWRNLWKNKVFSTINILGLALGMCCSILILLWVQNERSVDAFHKNGDDLYQAYERRYFDSKVDAQYNTPGLLAPELKKDIPEIKYAAGFGWDDPKTFKAGDKIIKMSGRAADSDFFKMFSFPLLEGNAQNALNTPAGLALSHKMAIAFFGSPEAAMGKTIRYDDRVELSVTAVFEDIGANSSVKFDYLVNWDQFMQDNDWLKDWGNYGPNTYIQLRPDANPEAVAKKVTHFLDLLDKNQKKGSFTEELRLQPFNETYLHNNFKDGFISGGRIEYVGLFTVIAFFILLIACINFMNLSTARSLKRAREIGVRKVIGAVRGVLIRQFLGESILLAIIAVIISLGLLVILLPLFNSITQRQIGLPFTEGVFWLKLLLIAFFTGFVSGCYPALFLSAFNPANVLKGLIRVGTGAARFRKGLVVFQFILSIVLIIGTIIITKQVNYIQSVDLGYNRENLLYIPLEGDLGSKYQAFKQKALQMPGIQSITRISQTPTTLQNSTGGVSWDGKDPNVKVQFTQAWIGYDFIPTMKLQMAAGRGFSRDFATDSVGYIINETALNKIGYSDPVGKPFTLWGKKGRIIGVVKDFHFNSLHDPIKPLVLHFGETGGYGSALIRTQPDKTKEALATLQTLSRELNPDFQFTYSFSDDEYKKLYDNEQLVSRLSGVFAFLAIFICCLGLLGLAIFTAEQRTKEIGIRKVMGASVCSLFILLSAEFLTLVLISLVIASPIAWYAMNKWLLNYAYHTRIEWWVFLFAGLIAILITLITISFQAVKAAIANPVTSLRSE